MLQITILSVGKTKESWLRLALEEYQKRLRPYLHLCIIPVRDDAELIKRAATSPRAIALDPKGALIDSVDFATRLATELEQGGSRLAFVIGGPEGLPPKLRQTLPLISLSPLTFTHQIARLVLTEQIYRAIEQHRGSPYHR